MKKNLIATTAFCFLLSLNVGNAQDLSTKTKNQVNQIVEVLPKLLDRIEKLENEIAGLHAAVPKDAVVAFNATNCPIGWKDVPIVAGRFILGASTLPEAPIKTGVRQLGGVMISLMMESTIMAFKVDVMNLVAVLGMTMQTTIGPP